jgi:hypothetical protein
MTNEDSKKIDIIKSKSRFVNSDFQMLIDVHKRCIGSYVNWQCPSCVRKAIDQLIEYQHKNK